MSKNIQTIGSDSFDSKVLNASGVVLVDFWAPWCAPCKALAPLLDELADDYAGEAVIAKVNADENGEVSDSQKVRGLPTLILFKDGVEKERVLGLVTKSRLANLLDKHLESDA